MADKFTKIILTGILVCLMVIASNSNMGKTTTPTPKINIDNSQQFIQIAPNRIGIVDTGTHTGNKGQLIVFDFDPVSKTFKYMETLNAPYILDHPEEFGIQVKSKVDKN